MLDTKTTFDENFDFHHYDLSLCMNAHRNGMKIGIAPISMIHYSHGKYDDRWLKSSAKFVDLYSQNEDWINYKFKIK